MSDDVLADWKRNRFIVADPFLVETTKHVIILTDINYWAEHADDLVEWCNLHEGVKTQGMTVEIDNDKTLTLFILRWS